MIGTKVGPYEITAKLGEGGMGEVYRATDSRLKRDVAIKVLPAAFTEDRERLQRFEREAQLLAQLHHPNIASIFGLEESNGERALVMELVEGPTLAERMSGGAMPLEESLSIARQIADALEAAHEKGIVHRDLKPQNVKASIDGKVKVLDFGLAKAMDRAGTLSSGGSGSQLAASPTMTLGATQFGMILGTAAYMAPEQAKGLGVDKRADIWAFGVVLFEMLSGRPLFASDSVPDTLARVLQRDVDFRALPESTPPAIRRLLRRCLERNPRNRLHDIADARIVLEEVSAGRADETAPVGGSSASSSPRRPWAVASVALAAGLALGVGAGILGSGSRIDDRPAPAVRQFEIHPPPETEIVPGLAMSPNGRHLAFVGRRESGGSSLWVRSLDFLVARELPGSEGALYPFWAPDSQRLAFFSRGRLQWIDTRGGGPIEMVSTGSIQDVRGGAWGADDVVLYTPRFTGPIYAFSLRAGGRGEPATRLPTDGSIGTTRFPSFLPDGRRFLFYASRATGTEPGTIHLGRLGTLESKLLGPATSAAVYAEPGYLLYGRGDALVAHRFDGEREELAGEAIPIGVSLPGSVAVSGHRSLSVAAGGMLVYRTDMHGASELVRVDRRGALIDTVAAAENTWYYAPRLSPDGRSVLAGQYQGPGGLGEIWIHDVERKVASRLTFGDSDAFFGAWLPPAGREVLYNCPQPNQAGSLCRVAVDRPSEPRVWLTAEEAQFPNAVTPDGGLALFERTEASGRLSLWAGAFDVQGPPKRLSPEGVSEFSADIAPDGRWLAFVSDATGEWEVYGRSLSGGGALRISTGGGMQPLWRRDGRELFYLDLNGRLVAVPIVPGDPPRPGTPAVLFAPRLEDAADRQYDASADGQRFLLNRRLTRDNPPIVVILDWTALLEGAASATR